MAARAFKIFIICVNPKNDVRTKRTKACKREGYNSNDNPSNKRSIKIRFFIPRTKFPYFINNRKALIIQT